MKKVIKGWVDPEKLSESLNIDKGRMPVVGSCTTIFAEIITTEKGIREICETPKHITITIED